MKSLTRILMVVVAIALSICVKSQEQNNIAIQILNKDSVPIFLIFKETDKRFLKGQEKEVFKEYLKTTKDDELKLDEIKKDDLGFTDEKYVQLYKGIPVEFSMYFVHCKNDTIETINGQFSRIRNLNISPKITREVALQRAKSYVGANLYMWEIPEAEQYIKNEKNNLTATYYPLGKLVIVQDKDKTEMRLAYKFEMYAYEPISRRNVYVDAISGAIIYDEPLIFDYDTPNADTRYSGQRFINTSLVNGKYRLLDITRGGGIEVSNLQTRLDPSSAVPFEDADNNWTALEWNNTQKDNLWGAEKFYDYFKVKHNRE